MQLFVGPYALSGMNTIVRRSPAIGPHPTPAAPARAPRATTTA
jgi:hypothetical protein